MLETRSRMEGRQEIGPGCLNFSPRTDPMANVRFFADRSVKKKFPVLHQRNVPAIRVEKTKEKRQRGKETRENGYGFLDRHKQRVSVARNANSLRRVHRRQRVRALSSNFVPSNRSRYRGPRISKFPPLGRVLERFGKGKKENEYSFETGKGNSVTESFKGDCEGSEA